MGIGGQAGYQSPHCLLYTSFTDSWSYVLNAASKNKDAAITFLKYMASEEGMKASYEAFDRYPARKDVAEKVVPDTDPAKEMYSRYANECVVRGRPMLPQTMEFISAMGTIFQSYMKDEITIDAVSYTHLDVYKRQVIYINKKGAIKYKKQTIAVIKTIYSKLYIEKSTILSTVMDGVKTAGGVLK